MSKQEHLVNDPIFFDHTNKTFETIPFAPVKEEHLQPSPIPPNPAKGRVKNKAAQKKVKKKDTPGSARGIETMFRTAYRSQLDLTALAATKANIMISLNGIILSVLTLSGPFVLVTEPMFSAPIAVFLATCLCSIIFAVLSAQPYSFKRKSTVDDFRDNNANILVFEHFSSLDKDEHSKLMFGLMRKNERIYQNMTWQLYLLGIAANRKFRLLKISYTSFLVGLTVSTLMLLIVIVIYHTIGLTDLMNSLQSRFNPLDPSR
ncbi:MAG: hypothetical protein KJ804_11360 [Proteobacteria bacterium]|nr:hypothetical protein [Pseudomonadota bacterium]MBU1058904.1 hypothetical protein [Pseudomonadota bacterium]